MLWQLAPQCLPATPLSRSASDAGQTTPIELFCRCHSLRRGDSCSLLQNTPARVLRMPRHCARRLTFPAEDHQSIKREPPRRRAVASRRNHYEFIAIRGNLKILGHLVKYIHFAIRQLSSTDSCAVGSAQVPVCVPSLQFNLARSL